MSVSAVLDFSINQKMIRQVNWKEEDASMSMNVQGISFNWFFDVLFEVALFYLESNCSQQSWWIAKQVS